jgi:virulence-associated protein VapD
MQDYELEIARTVFEKMAGSLYMKGDVAGAERTLELMAAVLQAMKQSHSLPAAPPLATGS